jgi:hypothetical protein
MHARSTPKIPQNASDASRGSLADILSEAEGATLDIESLSDALDVLLADVPLSTELPPLALRNVRAAIAIADQMMTRAAQVAELKSDADLLSRQMTTKEAENDIVAALPFRYSHDDMVGFIDVILDHVEALRVMDMALEGGDGLSMSGRDPVAYRLGVEVHNISRLHFAMNKCFQPEPAQPVAAGVA